MSRIAIVDDVVTEGGSTLDAVSKCLLVPYTIDQIIILLDRQQGGLERIRSEVSPRGVQVSAIFTKDEIHARWETQQAT
jgi:orotate phosphoribosyltransferase